MYELSDFKKGLKILLDGQPYSVVDFQHVLEFMFRWHSCSFLSLDL